MGSFMKKIIVLFFFCCVLFSACQNLSKENDEKISDSVSENVLNDIDIEVSLEEALKAAGFLKEYKEPEILNDSNFDISVDILEESRSHFINHFVCSKLPGNVAVAISAGETSLYLGAWNGIEWNEFTVETFWRNDWQLAKFKGDEKYLTLFDSVEDKYGNVLDFSDCLAAGDYYFRVVYEDNQYKGYFNLSLPSAVVEYLEEIALKPADTTKNFVINGTPIDKSAMVQVVENGSFGIVDNTTTENFCTFLSRTALASFFRDWKNNLMTYDEEVGHMGVFYPNRKVKLSPFQIGKYEVTQELFAAVMGYNPSNQIKDVAENERQKYRPVDWVSWEETVVFCNKLSLLLNFEPCYTIKSNGVEIDWTALSMAGFTAQKSNMNLLSAPWDEIQVDLTKNGFRLPTEAEWEFSARGGNPNSEEWFYPYTGCPNLSKQNYTYISDSLIGEYAWWALNNNSKTHEVGLKLPNSIGIYDMMGNVLEWCLDYYIANAAYFDSEFKTDESDSSMVVNPCHFHASNYNRGHSYRPGARMREKTTKNNPNKKNCLLTTRDFSVSVSNLDCSAMGFRLCRTTTE